MFYILNLHNVVCQLYFSKAGEKVSSSQGCKSRLSDDTSTTFDSRMSQRLLVFGLEGLESDI